MQSTFSVYVALSSDHVHVLFRAQPKPELSKFINAYKSASSRLIKKEFPAIRTSLWKEMFWSQSFCLISTGGARQKIPLAVRTYPCPECGAVIERDINAALCIKAEGLRLLKEGSG